MKSIKDGQSNLIHDTCTHCGSFVDIGAVIDIDDTQLALHFTGEQALEQAQSLADKASARFDKVKVDIQATESGVNLIISFDVSAEKMIFQLENRL